ncbi:hypothetical protein A3862_27430 [Methylobacterium sp. XJLW]|uniref:hypothetical protein n=1 Tax=Methylobacterium sp. XJLW TaxID=739141 RepID=UPI000DAAFB2A|nr:hypothetical protein [Methylobacterium sp. XJLW]AWV18814.1 hypothetical protein A3862_27430 [Methylobacterium sp. XJLW]
MSLEDNGGAPAPGEQQPNTTGAQAAPDARQDQGAAPAGGDQGAGGGGEGGDQGSRSLAQGGGEERPDPAPTAKWPDDWREQLAGGDEAFLKQLKRYASPANYAKAGFEAQQRIRSGQAKEPLPDNPSPEQITAWRKENGIPEKAEDYKIEPGDGLVFGEADKPMLDAFRQFAHERNWTPQQVNQGAAFVAQLGEQQRAAMDQADKSFRMEAQDALQQEWGREFRPNLQNIRNIVDRYGEPGFGDALMGARSPDGKLLGDNPAFLRLLNTFAREINPLGTVVPAGTQDAGKAASEELAALRAEMGDQSSAYWRGPEAEKKQARYRELLTAVEKQSARA